MAQAFPRSQFIGFDYHAGLDRHRDATRARKPASPGRCHFEIGEARSYPGGHYDFVTIFDALHDMGDPAGAARHVLSTLAPGGTWMIVEPYAGDRVEENLNPVGRAYYAGSTLMCTPCSLVAGRRAWGWARRPARRGCVRWSRARDSASSGARVHSPVNLVFEARAEAREIRRPRSGSTGSAGWAWRLP